LFVNLIKQLVREHNDSEQKKEELYSALCNVIWYKADEPIMYSASWRYAGTLIAEAEDIEAGTDDIWRADYLKYFSSGQEGYIAPWISEALEARDWFPADYARLNRSPSNNSL
jgi:hypothetical protein